MSFTIYTELYNHQQLILEHFHLPKKKPHTISIHSPFDPISLPKP